MTSGSISSKGVFAAVVMACSATLALAQTPAKPATQAPSTAKPATAKPGAQKPATAKPPAAKPAATNPALRTPSKLTATAPATYRVAFDTTAGPFVVEVV